jgi:hypothetical protein
MSATHPWCRYCGGDRPMHKLPCEEVPLDRLRYGLCLEAVADAATFQIARTLNRSRADSYAARQRWWRVYAAYPQIYREAAWRVWQSAVYQATKDDDSARHTRPRELLARLRRPLYSV